MTPIPHGLVWLHCVRIGDVPVGKRYESEVLLADHDSTTGTIALLEHGGARVPLVGGTYLSGWQVYHSETATRPTPLLTEGWVQSPVSSDIWKACIDFRGDWVWESPRGNASGAPLEPGTMVFADYELEKLLITIPKK